MQLTQSRLFEVLDYSPETGIFTWKIRRGRSKAGIVAGSLKPDGYIYISVDCRDQKAHRLAFLYQTGMFPEHCVDHINGQRNDNRWSNLRDVTFDVNCQNKRTPKTGKKYSQLIGVTVHKKTGLFVASVKLKGKTVFCKYFREEGEAHKAYLDAKRIWHTGCTI